MTYRRMKSDESVYICVFTASIAFFNTVFFLPLLTSAQMRNSSRTATTTVRISFIWLTKRDDSQATAARGGTYSLLTSTGAESSKGIGASVVTQSTLQPRLPATELEVPVKHISHSAEPLLFLYVPIEHNSQYVCAVLF